MQASLPGGQQSIGKAWESCPIALVLHVWSTDPWASHRHVQRSSCSEYLHNNAKMLCWFPVAATTHTTAWMAENNRHSFSHSLEVKSLRSMYWLGDSFWRLWGRVCSRPPSGFQPVVPGNPWCSLIYRCITATSASVFTPRVSVCLKLPLLIKTLIFGFGTQRDYICKDLMSK